MDRKRLVHTYNDIISVENLLGAWKSFLKGKRKKSDVQLFQYYLLDNIRVLHAELRDKKYMHGSYCAFNISDPKPRNIHKALIRDRLVHHAIYRGLYSFFDSMFIADSYSCRKKKGTHKALMRFHSFAFRASKNNTKTLWILKCDIKKFFASVDQDVLLAILEKRIFDKDILWLLEGVVQSFVSNSPHKGLPLGNLTSQLLVNIYMNEFDQFVKHELRVKYYIRYADDFVLMNRDKQALLNLLPQIERFLSSRLHLVLHPGKVFVTTIASGVDFLGWVHFPNHRVLRTATKQRMLRNVRVSEKPETLQSYLGLLRHGNTYKLKLKLESQDS